MGKDLKIKHDVSSPTYKVWGNFFIKKLSMEEQTFLGNFFSWVIDILFEKLTPQIGD